MAKFSPAALAILGILWLIRDLYALENNPRFPREIHDFYFNDAPTPASNPGPVPDAPGNLLYQGIPLQPSDPRKNANDNQPSNQDGGENKAPKKSNSGGKTDDRESASKEKDIKKLLKNLVSVLLNLNDEEDSLINQLQSYLGNENDQPPKDIPEQIGTPSTVSNAQSMVDMTTPATTTPSDNDRDEDDYSPCEDDEDNDNTSEIPSTTVKNMVMKRNTNSTTPKPDQYLPSGSQAGIPSMNNSNPIADIFQDQNEMGINPNNEFIDDIINSAKYTPKNEENSNNSIEPNKIILKPLSLSPNEENIPNQGKKNDTKSPISEGINDNFGVPLTPKEMNNSGNDSSIPQTQTPSTVPWYLSPSLTEKGYEFPFINEMKPTAESSTVKPMPVQQNFESQMPHPYPVRQQKFESQIPHPYPVDQQNVYSKPNFFLPRGINFDQKPSYNNEPVPNMFKHVFRPSHQFLLRRKPLPIDTYNQPYVNRFDTPRIIYPQNLQPQTNQLQTDTPPETVPFAPKYPTDQYTTPSNKLPIQNNPQNDLVSNENESTKTASTEFPFPFNQTEVPKEPNSSTTETPPSIENAFYGTETPVPQNEVPSVNPTVGFPIQNELNKPELSPENENKTPQGPQTENQGNTTDGSLTPRYSTEITPTSENPLKDEPQNEKPLNSTKNMYLPLEVKQTTDAPNVAPQTTTLPDDSQEIESEESDDDYPSSEEDDYDDSDEDDDSSEDDDEESVEDDSSDDDALHDISDADDASKDNDKSVENILSFLDNIKALINNATLEAAQNSSVPTMSYSTESPENSPTPLTSDLNRSSQNPPVLTTNDFKESPKSTSTPNVDYTTESPMNGDDDNQNTEPSNSKETPSQNTESPMNVNDGKQNAEPSNSKGPPYQSILDYIYSFSKNAFFRDLKEEQGGT